MNFHLYGGWQDMPGVSEWLHVQMEKQGYTVPLVSTEAGGPFLPHSEAYTEQLHSQDIVKWHCMALSCGVEIFMWSSHVAVKSWGKNFANTALVDWKTNQLKPAYYTYCLLVRKLSKIKSVRRIPILGYEWDKLTRVYEFETGKGKIWVAWSDRVSGRSMRLDLPYKRLKITKIDGTIKELRPEKRRFLLNLTHSPLFIEAE